ncbi:MAG: hypothetical protein LC791_20830 [Acidobacteria bacterium]|nr:hypothetical protein [Acidobacteriota bacterium]
MPTPKVIVNRDFDPFYHALYIKGLHELFAAGEIAYSLDDFPRSLSHQMAFIVTGPRPRHVFVCHSDYASYHGAGLEWCELYAKINIDPGAPAPRRDVPVLAIGPSFGVQIYSPLSAFYRACISFRFSDANPREHFANYYRQRRYRLPEASYTPGRTAPDYIFFAGTLWPDDPETNASRARFIEACSSIPHVRFEGGFRPVPKTATDRGEYDHLTAPREYALAEYLEHTKRSVVVFNTPAVGGCLGWKLGEFLALGKAIISTPLNRTLPAPLVHGQHVHYVDGSREAIKDAIELVRRDTGYRTQLERGARQYYVDYLRPTAVMTRVLNAAAGADRVPAAASAYA